MGDAQQLNFNSLGFQMVQPALDHVHLLHQVTDLRQCFCERLCEKGYALALMLWPARCGERLAAGAGGAEEQVRRNFAHSWNGSKSCRR